MQTGPDPECFYHNHPRVRATWTCAPATSTETHVHPSGNCAEKGENIFMNALPSSQDTSCARRLHKHFNTLKEGNAISSCNSELNYREQIVFEPQVILVS